MVVDRVVIVNRMDATVCVVRLNGAEVGTRLYIAFLLKVQSDNILLHDKFYSSFE